VTQPLDAAAVFRRLHAARIDYVLVGGLAVIAWGVQRFTKDVDICPDPARPNLERLAQLLRETGARQVGEQEFAPGEMPHDPTHAADLARGGNFLVETRIGRLDIMQWLPGISEDRAYAVLAEEAVEVSAFGVSIRVCSLEHLRQMKRAAGRPLDVKDLEDLASAHGDEEGR
jgi:hypothetical protein